MKKWMIFAAVLAVAAGAASAMLYSGYRNFLKSGRFLDGTHLTSSAGSVDVGGMDAAKAYAAYTGLNMETVEFNLSINGKSYGIDMTECFDRMVGEEEIAKLIGQDGFFEWLKKDGRDIRLENEYKYLGGAGKISGAFLESGNYSYEPCKDAWFDKENMTVVPEEEGSEADPEKAAELVEAAIQNGKLEADLSDAKKQPAVKEDEIAKRFSGVMEILKWSASYDKWDFKINLSDHKDSIHVEDDGSYEIDKSFLKGEVLALSKKVDHVYTETTLYKPDGNVKVKGGTYGEIMSNAREIRFLEEKLSAGESVKDRTPEWICRPLPEGENPDDYIEVDIERQKVIHYANGRECCSSDTVTGNLRRNMGTPTGAYYVTEKIPGKYLTGPGYKTWVNRWMRLTNSGIGLHDAGRVRFGGQIYRTNGSHGCINLPPSYARSLYDEISTGILVVVHE